MLSEELQICVHFCHFYFPIISCRHHSLPQKQAERRGRAGGSRAYPKRKRNSSQNGSQNNWSDTVAHAALRPPFVTVLRSRQQGQKETPSVVSDRSWKSSGSHSRRLGSVPHGSRRRQLPFLCHSFLSFLTPPRAVCTQLRFALNSAQKSLSLIVHTNKNHVQYSETIERNALFQTVAFHLSTVLFKKYARLTLGPACPCVRGI